MRARMEHTAIAAMWIGIALLRWPLAYLVQQPAAARAATAATVGDATARLRRRWARRR